MAERPCCSGAAIKAGGCFESARLIVGILKSEQVVRGVDVRIRNAIVMREGVAMIVKVEDAAAGVEVIRDACASRRAVEEVVVISLACWRCVARRRRHGKASAEQTPRGIVLVVEFF